MSIGAELKQAREELGLSLEEVVETTKIRKKYIVAMENDDFNVLPSGAYAKGFLRNYARLLMLDAENLIKQYEMQYQSKVEMEPGVTTHTPEPKMKKAATNWRPLAILVGLLVVLGVVYWTGAFVYNSYNPQDDMAGAPERQITVDDNQDTDEEEQNQDTSSGVENQDGNGVDPGQENMNVVLQVTNNVCWMRVLVDEQNVFEGNVEPGVTKTFQGNESVVVWLGNAGAVKVTVNGEDYGYLGEPYQVVKRTFASTLEPSDG